MKKNYIKLSKAISYCFGLKYQASNPYTHPELCIMLESIIDKKISRHILFTYWKRKISLFYYISGDATPSVLTNDLEKATLETHSFPDVYLSSHQDWVNFALSHTDYIFIK